jgi:hypothetical protein
MLVHEKVAQAFSMAWCAPCAMGRAKFDFGPKIFLVFSLNVLASRLKYFQFWVRLVSL